MGASDVKLVNLISRRVSASCGACAPWHPASPRVWFLRTLTPWRLGTVWALFIVARVAIRFRQLCARSILLARDHCGASMPYWEDDKVVGSDDLRLHTNVVLTGGTTICREIDERTAGSTNTGPSQSLRSGWSRVASKWLPSCAASRATGEERKDRVLRGDGMLLFRLARWKLHSGTVYWNSRLHTSLAEHWSQETEAAVRRVEHQRGHFRSPRARSGMHAKMVRHSALRQCHNVFSKLLCHERHVVSRDVRQFAWLAVWFVWHGVVVDRGFQSGGLPFGSNSLGVRCGVANCNVGCGRGGILHEDVLIVATRWFTAPISIRHVRTTEQLAGILTNGSFATMQWKTFVRLFNTHPPPTWNVNRSISESPCSAVSSHPSPGLVQRPQLPARLRSQPMGRRAWRIVIRNCWSELRVVKPIAF